MGALIITASCDGDPDDILMGPINDGRRMWEFLSEKGFAVTWLRDDTPWFYSLTGPDLSTSKENVKHWMYSLTHESKSGDSLFVYYSGHGNDPSDDSSEEDADKKDYHIYLSSGQRITNKTMHKLLVAGVPQEAEDVSLFAIWDCCHSRTMLDLDYTYNVKTKTPNTHFASLELPDPPKSSKLSSSSDEIDVWDYLCKASRIFNITKCLRKTAKTEHIDSSSLADATDSSDYQYARGLRVTSLCAARNKETAKDHTAGGDEYVYSGGSHLSEAFFENIGYDGNMVTLLENITYDLDHQPFLHTLESVNYLKKLSFDE